MAGVATAGLPFDVESSITRPTPTPTPTPTMVNGAIDVGGVGGDQGSINAAVASFFFFIEQCSLFHIFLNFNILRN